MEDILATAKILRQRAGSIGMAEPEIHLDIDSTAGTALDIALDRAIDQDPGTRIMSAAGIVPTKVATGGKNDERITVRFDEILKPEELNEQRS